jgi:hypothetical protein
VVLNSNVYQAEWLIAASKACTSGLSAIDPAEGYFLHLLTYKK